MLRYWIIAPVGSKEPELFDRVWQFDFASNVISIGWSQLGDVSRMSRVALSDAVASAFPASPSQTKSLFVNMIWAFYHEVVPGDIVVARRGRKTLAAVGTVTKSAYDAPGKNPHLATPGKSHRSFIDVSWQEHPRDKSFSSIVFPMHTLSEFTEGQYHSLLKDPPTQPPIDKEVEDPSAFVLEKYLEEFIVSNFETIFRGTLKVYEDNEGSDGQQYTTDIGPIDILAVEQSIKSFVVIELKKGRPSDQVVGQILRYMGWVKEKLCTEGQGVKGLVICRDPDPKLSYALAMTSDIQVRYYSVSFKLKEAP